MRKITTFILLIVIMTSCTSNPEPIPYLLENTCELPCFYNVKPGFTTLEESLTELSAIPNINKASIRTIPEDTYYPYARVTWDMADQLGVIFSIRDDKVRIIELTPYKFLRFDSFINYYGPPDSFAFSDIGGDCSGPYSLRIIYEKIGVILYSVGCFNSSINKNQNLEKSRLTGLYLFDPDYFIEFANQFLFRDITSSQELSEKLIPWSKYTSPE